MGTTIDATASPTGDTMTNAPAVPHVPDLPQVYEDLMRFRAGFSTLVMATGGADGEPDASYAAYIEEDGDFYVYVSELSRHTKNLMETERVSVLFIEDEASAGHPFTRRRLTYQCRAEEVARGTSQFDGILLRFEDRFGGLIATLRGLRDFHLFRLRPRSACYVTGFARAFAIDEVQLGEIRHIRTR
jgi:heme iron utilization protein